MTQIALFNPPKFHPHRPARPMMARDADSMYWMSRYVERAEHIARLLLINSNLLVDVGDLALNIQQREWQSVLGSLRVDSATIPPGDGALGMRVASYLAFDPENPSSLLCCLTRARENARGIRENISLEMWESLNTLYWSISADEARTHFEESPDDFYRQVIAGSMLFQGLTDQTLSHDQGWLFIQLGKFLERVEVTCRIIEHKFNVLPTEDPRQEGALRTIHWMAVLRCCCSIEAYRRHHVGDMDPMRVASFLILERNFPRSVRYGVGKAHDAIAAIRNEVNPLAIDPAERVLGRLDAQLEYAELSEMLVDGIPTYLQKIQTQLAEVAVAMQNSYFQH